MKKLEKKQMNAVKAGKQKEKPKKETLPHGAHPTVLPLFL